MIKNYFTIAFRNIVRNKGFSVINISGLAIGMASAVLIFLWIQNETSYDRFHANEKRIYLACTNIVHDGSIQSGTATPQLMGPALKTDCSEIENAARVGWNQSVLFGYGEKKIKANGTWADPSFLTMFSFPLVKGNRATALSGPHSLVITESMAKKLFGDEDGMGKTVQFDNQENFTVTGIMKDLPSNTQFNFEFLNSSAFLQSKGYFDADWTNVSIKTFVLLYPASKLANANASIKDITKKYSGGLSRAETFLYPLNQLRLYAKFENGKVVGGRIETVRIFAIIALFILLIACINFMNLSTARSEKRAREVGVRKVAGAMMKTLVAQFLSESVVMATIAGLFALLIVQFSLPAFNQLTQKHLSINYGSVAFWGCSIGFILFTGILAGSYPAFVLASFKPAAVLKGSFKKVNTLITPRKTLVVLQFTFAIILIICTIIAEKQLTYGQERETGYDKKNLVYIAVEGDVKKNYQLIKNELLLSGTAISVSQSMAPLTQSWSGGSSLKWQGQDPNAHIGFDRSTTDGGLVKTAGLQLIAGRDIDPDTYPTDSTACLINETAAKLMNFKDPIGQEVFDDPLSWHIVGVIKDFVLQSPYSPIKPMIFKGPKYGRMTVNIRFNSKKATAANIAAATAIFKKYNPAYPFEYKFVDEEYAKKFDDQKLTGILAALFSGLTISISCLGLFGLATFMAESRTKEIGVRKILGASVTSIAALLSGDFIKLVIIAIVIASPVAWWIAGKWLEGYSYRTSVSWWMFAGAGIAAILIALVTVSFQAIKAALTNPVKSLRTE